VDVKIAAQNGEEFNKIHSSELTDGFFNNAQDSVCLPIHNGSEYVLYFQLTGGLVHLLLLYVEGNRRVAFTMSCATIQLTYTQVLYQKLTTSILLDLKTGR
jgi:hypothetical protein